MPYKDKQQGIEYSRKYYHANRERYKMLRACHRYNISQERYIEMMTSPCMICGDHAVHIDHNHDTGATRGGLCLNCNQGIGKLKDSPHLLIRAAEYLSYFEEIADGFEIQRPETEGRELG